MGRWCLGELRVGVRGVMQRTARLRGSMRRVWRSVLLAVLLVLVFSSGTCVVVYCSEDCDPCVVDTCKCHTCSHHPPDFDASHRLAGFELSLAVDLDGRVTRIYSGILGLSLDRALGARAHDEAELVRFARDVLAVNADRFGPRAGAAWVLDGVERIERSTVATFHEASVETVDPAASTATLLFDASGNLLEIDHALR